MPRRFFPFIKVSDRLLDDDKFDGLPLAIKFELAGALVHAWGTCHDSKKDGVLSDERFAMIGTARTRRLMLDRKFAVEVPGGVEMRHYLDYHPSQDKQQEISEARRRARGSRRQQEQDGNNLYPAEGNNLFPAGEQVVPTPGNKLPGEVEIEVEREIDPSPLSPVAELEGADEPPPAMQPDDDESQDQEDLARVVMAEVFRATGHPIDHAAAESLLVLLLGDRRPRNPVAYVRAVIRGEPRPRERFLPSAKTSSGPPAAGSLCRKCGGSGHQAADCPHARRSERDEPPPRGPATPLSTHPAPGLWPDPGIAKGGAELARGLMTERHAEEDTPGAGDDPDEVPF